MQHNLAWFNHYLFGDPKPNLTMPAVTAATDKEIK
jgi:hypothetical protein